MSLQTEQLSVYFIDFLRMTLRLLKNIYAMIFDHARNTSKI